MSVYRYKLLGGYSNEENSFRKGFLFSFVIMSALFGLFYFYSDSESSTVGSKSTVLPNYQSFAARRQVYDAMDGEGYQFKKEASPIVLDPRFDQLLQLPSCGNLESTFIKTEVQEKLENVKNSFLACINPIVQGYRGRPMEMYLDWVPKAEVCDKLPVFEELGVVPFQNLHETKWAILPKCKEEHNFVTLGVGHDTIAEEKFNRTLPNVKFYGADPIIEPNIRMYSAFGKFFPFAIGREPGFTQFRVLPNQNQKTRKYVYEDVTTIPFLFFVRDILKLKRIDFAWFDIEGGEFEFLDQLHNEITICQFNIEIHQKFRPQDGAQKFHDFIFEVLERKKYVFLKSVLTGVGVHRMFFVNLEDKECVAKFFN